VRDPELPGDVAGPDPVVSELDDPLPDDVGKRSAVDEDAAELIDAAVTCDGLDSNRGCEVGLPLCLHTTLKTFIQSRKSTIINDEQRIFVLFNSMHRLTY